MRPGQKAPDNVGDLWSQLSGDACFNEAGAKSPG